jgi:multiple sugar transport system ATP-binding protein
MNFFDATLTGDRDQMYVDGGSFRLKVPTAKAELLRGYMGQRVVFGVRPEDVHDADYAPPGITGSPLTARVDVTEMMGNEVFLYLLSGTRNFVARVDPRTSARVGGEARTLINMDNMHVFDRESERLVI